MKPLAETKRFAAKGNPFLATCRKSKKNGRLLQSTYLQRINQSHHKHNQSKVN